MRENGHAIYLAFLPQSLLQYVLLGSELHAIGSTPAIWTIALQRQVYGKNVARQPLQIMQLSLLCVSAQSREWFASPALADVAKYYGYERYNHFAAVSNGQEYGEFSWH